MKLMVETPVVEILLVGCHPFNPTHRIAGGDSTVVASTATSAALRSSALSGKSKLGDLTQCAIDV